MNWLKENWKPYSLALLTVSICLAICLGVFWVMWKIHPVLCGFVLGILVDRIGAWSAWKKGVNL